MSFDGATGHIEFDAKGDRKDAEMTIFQLKGGNVVPVAIIKAGKTTKLDAPAATAMAPAAAPAAPAMAPATPAMAPAAPAMAPAAPAPAMAPAAPAKDAPKK